MPSNLSGTVAVVTGASSGIGEATARRLARDGASVALVARRRDRLEALAAEIAQVGGTALAVEADITDRTQAEAAVQQTVERFGCLDILVNNAGLMLLGPVVGADTEEWDRMISVNARGLLYVTHAALPYLLEAVSRPSSARTTAERSARRSTPSTQPPRPWHPTTSPTASPTWLPDPGTPPSASCGSCPPTRSASPRRHGRI